MPNNPNKPVVAIDVDGTLGRYHEHFLSFAENWIGLPENESLDLDWEGAKGEFSAALGIDKTTYRQIKLAYRAGGTKRTMPVYEGAQQLVRDLRMHGAEVWICTTRPWQRMDNIDPDTQEFFRRRNIEFDGLIYGDDKYEQLIEIVGKGRIVAVLDDLPEQYLTAESLGLDPMLIRRPHNEWAIGHDLHEFTTWRFAHSLYSARDWAVKRVEEWKDNRMNRNGCDMKGCTVPLAHTHGTDNPIVIQLGEEIAEHEHSFGRKCSLRGASGSRAWVYEQAETGFLYRCDLEHSVAALPDTEDRGSFGMPTVCASYREIVEAEGGRWLLEQATVVPKDVEFTVVRPPHPAHSQSNRVCNIMDEAQTLFKQKSAGYGPPTSEDLGARGQFADMHRKWKRLRKTLWDGEPWSDSGESIEEVLMDFFGHIGLTIDFLRQGEKQCPCKPDAPCHQHNQGGYAE